MRKLLFPAVAVAISSPANAAPVYLQCPISASDGRGEVQVSVTLNEDTGTAGIVVNETGYAVQGVTAAFTPTAVSWNKQDGRFGHTRYSVDRTTLEFIEEIYVGDKLFSTRRGTCVIANIAERKF